MISISEISVNKSEHMNEKKNESTVSANQATKNCL